MANNEATSGRHRRGRRRSNAAPMADINIVPLVDVVLVLLIIFMVTAAFVKDDGLQMKLPTAGSAAAPGAQARDAVVAVTRDGRFYLDGSPLSEAALGQSLRQRAAAAPNTRLVIRGDRDAAYQRVIRVLDLAAAAGLSNTVLSTEPDS